jgi:Fe2+ or Zn2+ uptake regulation protein
MKQLNLTAAEQSVLNAVQEEHLTSFQILKKVDNVPMILSLYNVLDQLTTKGVIKSYVKQNQKYHCAS